MDEELIALAEAGATALVAAMSTDLWQSARDAVLGLFRRSDRRRRAEVERRLDGNAALVAGADHPEEVRQALSGLWAGELELLLRQDPASRAPLALLAARLGGAPGDGRPAVAFEQTNTARDHGTVIAVQHGDQEIHGVG